MAIIKQLSTAFTGAGATAPKLTKIDRIESAGSLILLDMSKVSALPNNGGTFTNLFETQQKTITGANSNIVYNTAIADATISRVERTPKGGLHFIGKKAVQATYPTNYAQIQATGGVHDYIVNNWKGLSSDHSFYFSLWARVTAQNVVSNGQNGTFYPMNFSHNGNANQERVNFMSGNTSTAVGTMRIGSTSIYGYLNSVISPPTLSTNFNLFNGGKTGLNGVFGTNREYESIIFYRFYVEDLTVSGRAWGDVDALDASLFTSAFASGGKFYGDTWTDPATL